VFGPKDFLSTPQGWEGRRDPVPVDLDKKADFWPQETKSFATTLDLKVWGFSTRRNTGTQHAGEESASATFMQEALVWQGIHVDSVE